jgi:hypothetical protein
MSAKLLLPFILVIGLGAVGCTSHSAIQTPTPSIVEPSGGPSAVPQPLPVYPYDPGFWV